ncbi:helix-turn-helix transcriptional regulator [Pseudactinotalea suaedae]|uniref:helix-turn-helix transcriptional regulator n=1 Tax=Pseudactinotalea suaedae TaxID=1524924 RepID=UPI001F4FD307|nr:helix-turn-helix transcriptional regulator [Pseudactinotalea suaedae]
MIRPRTPRREQLGEFLTSRRRGMSRSAVGLPPTTRRSDAGLSREEVATLSGVSGTWYTWLEQGRDINVSRQVLAAVARVLGLTAAEIDYVIALAEREDDPVDDEPEDMPAHLQHLLDALDFPAFALTTDWTIAGWNAAYARLYPPIATLDAADRNLLWLVYTDPGLRELLPDWEQDSRRFLAEFRAESGVRLSAPRHQALVDRLRERSADFRAQWAELTIERFASRRRTFRAGDDGLLVFEHHRMEPSETTGLHVVMYVPTA